MKIYYSFLALSFAILGSCHSQTPKISRDKSEENAPHEKVFVNRKYDEKGNLIKFDSVYTSYYSTSEGDTIALDSTLKDFEFFFNDHLPTIRHSSVWRSDSSLISKIFHDDYFEKQFIEQNELMLKMIQQMDSIKNEFFKNQHELYLHQELQ